MWVPDRLPRVDVARALAVVELPLHLNWSAPGRVFDSKTPTGGIHHGPHRRGLSSGAGRSAIVALFYARVMTQKAAMGALPTLRAATDPGVPGDQYYGPGGFFGARGYPKLAKSSGQSHDTAIQRSLRLR